MDKSKLMELAKNKIAEVVGFDVAEIDENEAFLNMGIASIQAVKIINLMQKELEVELEPTLLFEYETLVELVDYLAENLN